MKSFTLEWFNAQNGQNQPPPHYIIIELQFPENMLILSLIAYKRVSRNSIQLGLGRVAMTKESTWLPVTKGLTDLWVKHLKPSASPCVKYIIIQTQILNYKIIKTILLNIIISTVFQCDTFRESKFSEIFFAQESVNSFISQ